MVVGGAEDIGGGQFTGCMYLCVDIGRVTGRFL